MNSEIRELSLDELDQVSGGSPVPGGTVIQNNQGTLATFNNGASIWIKNDGTIQTQTSPNGPITTTRPPGA
jgi:hypothetical protein